jgi:hypothetical protein
MDLSQKKQELVGKGGIINSLFLAIAPVLFYVCVKEAYCTAMFIGIVLLSNKLLISGKKMSMKGFAVIAILIAMLTGGIYFHHQFHANGNNQEVAQEQQEEKEEEAQEQEEEQEQEDQDQDKNQGKKTGVNKGSNERIVVTNNSNNPNKAKAVGGVKDPSKEQTFKDNTNAEQTKESQKREQEDIENGKTVTKQKDHETTSDYKEGLEDKNEGAKEAVINPENGKEVKKTEPTYGPAHIDIPTQEETHTSSNNNESKETKIVEAKTEEVIPEVKPVEEVQEVSDDELAKIFEEKTTTTAEEVNNDEKVNTKATKAIVEENTVIENEAKGKVEVVEEKTNTTAPVQKEEVKVEVKKFESVSISAIDGNSAMVNSTIQYRVNGDVAKIEGLDGLSYSMNNGILTIQTGAEATAVYFEVTGQDGSVAVAEFTVNGFNR